MDKGESNQAPRTGAWARGAVSGLAAVRIGAAQLGQRVRGVAPDDAQALAEHQAEVGRILFAAMSQLRGTALKVSQILSMDAMFLPQPVRAELAKACHQVTPLNRALVGRVFRQALGQEPQALFEYFEPVAFAAASLGQVHRAELAGIGPVAVKIQYPGIASTIASDMRIVRSALKLISQSTFQLPDPSVVDQVLTEIETSLHRETDYLQEARQMQWFAHHITVPDVVVPRPVPTHSAKTVLTQEFLPGLHLADWLATQPTQAQRNHMGQTLFDFFMQTAFGLGHLHADPHPGNYLFMPDQRLGVLDFGCTRALASSFRQHWAATWSIYLALADQPQACAEQLLPQYQALGLARADARPAQFAHQVFPALAPLLAWATEPFQAAEFDFARKSPPPKTDQAYQKVLAPFIAQVPPEMPLFDRSWMGLMHLLTQLGATVRTQNPWVNSGTAAARGHC